MCSLNSINNLGNVQMVKCIPTFMWTINNFCACHSKVGEALKSPIFTMGKNNKFEWCIHLYPKGFDEKYTDYVSLFLQLESYDQNDEGEVDVKYKFSMLNNKNEKVNEMGSDTSRVFTSGCDWGFREFVLKDFLFDEENGLLPDNKLTIYCEIDIIKCDGKLFTENTTIPVQISDNQTKVLDDLEVLLKTRKNWDIVIVVNDKKFYAHKAILAARSSVFSKMFEHNIQQKGAHVLEINEFDQKIMKELLRYIYIGRVEDIKKMAQLLLPVANKYALDGLKVICEDTICKSLCVDNAADILAMADHYDAHKLKKEAMNFIILNGEDVISSQAFKTMVTSQPHLITEVFQTMVSKNDPLETPTKKRKRSDSSINKEK